ncbi:MAG: hypothetical protein VW771_05890 [Gammaproteobacteria bacterium]
MRDRHSDDDRPAGLLVRSLRLRVVALTVLMLSAVHAQEGTPQGGDPVVDWQGEALVEVGPFGLDVYIARFFDSGTGVKLIELEYLRDVLRRFSLMGWERGLAPFDVPTYQEAVNWIKDKTPDIKEGDRFRVRVEGTSTTVLLNGITIGESDDPLVAEIILSPWVGDPPVHLEVKQKLLGDRA